MTASRKLKDLKSGGPGFIAFGLIAPNVFATFGICRCPRLCVPDRHPFQLGSYVLFSVLCAAASYIAVPAVQRLAIPEASPTLAAGGIAGSDVFVQCDDRHPGLYRGRSAGHEGVSGRLNRFEPVRQRPAALTCGRRSPKVPSRIYIHS